MLETSNDMIINTPDAMRVDAVSISDLKKKERAREKRYQNDKFI